MSADGCTQSEIDEFLGGVSAAVPAPAAAAPAPAAAAPAAPRPAAAAPAAPAAASKPPAMNQARANLLGSINALRKD